MATPGKRGGAELPGKRKCEAGSLALPALLFLAVALAGMATPSAAAVYKVGDSLGWTIRGNPNYAAWAASKTFHVGDTIVFVYNNTFHNVLEVSQADYQSCSAKSPKSTHTTGNDSISLNSPGHHFFLCGIPGHCDAGQKVDVNVLASAAGPAASPGPSSSSSAPPTGSPGSSNGGQGIAPAPEKNRATPAATPDNYVMGCAVGLLAAAVALLCL